MTTVAATLLTLALTTLSFGGGQDVPSHTSTTSPASTPTTNNGHQAPVNFNRENMNANLHTNQRAILDLLNNPHSPSPVRSSEAVRASENSRVEVLERAVFELKVLVAGLDTLREVVADNRMIIRLQARAYERSCMEGLENPLHELQAGLDTLREEVAHNRRLTGQQGQNTTGQVMQNQQNDTVPSSCSGKKVLHGTWGAIAVPEDQYIHNLSCSWTVVTPPSTVIVIKWIYLNLEECTSCSCDWVMLNDTSPFPSSFYGKKLCGHNDMGNNTEWVTSTNKLVVTFATDHSVKRQGFYLEYQAQ